jgi:hypothetical protein
MRGQAVDVEGLEGVDESLEISWRYGGQRLPWPSAAEVAERDSACGFKVRYALRRLASSRMHSAGWLRSGCSGYS